jgi:hypothetical protein
MVVANARVSCAEIQSSIEGGALRHASNGHAHPTTGAPFRQKRPVLIPRHDYHAIDRDTG